MKKGKKGPCTNGDRVFRRFGGKAKLVSGRRGSQITAP